ACPDFRVTPANGGAAVSGDAAQSGTFTVATWCAASVCPTVSSAQYSSVCDPVGSGTAAVGGVPLVAIVCCAPPSIPTGVTGIALVVAAREVRSRFSSRAERRKCPRDADQHEDAPDPLPGPNEHEPSVASRRAFPTAQKRVDCT